jgi:type IV secretory pathway VirJ component
VPARRPGAEPARSRPGALTLLAALAALLLPQCALIERAGHPQLISSGPFSDIHVYQPLGPAQRLALVLSGDGGWSYNIGSIARQLATHGTLVAGIDTREWLAHLTSAPQSCISPGAELAALARELERRYSLSAQPPVLVGHSAGATLAYVALAQAPAGSFAGALTLSFCADLDVEKPLCEARNVPSQPRSGGITLLPPEHLAAPWVAFHGLADTVCPASDSQSFAAALPGARFVPLPEVTHNYQYRSSWWGPFAAAYAQLAGTAPPPASAKP